MPEGSCRFKRKWAIFVSTHALASIMAERSRNKNARPQNLRPGIGSQRPGDVLFGRRNPDTGFFLLGSRQYLIGMIDPVGGAARDVTGFCQNPTLCVHEQHRRISADMMTVFLQQPIISPGNVSGQSRSVAENPVQPGRLFVTIFRILES